MHSSTTSKYAMFLEELERLDRSLILVEGKEYKATECYYLELDPVHVLFNENCPETLKLAINELLRKYNYL